MACGRMIGLKVLAGTTFLFALSGSLPFAAGENNDGSVIADVTQPASTHEDAPPLASTAAFPQVIYENGELTIKTQNSTLLEVLGLIAAKTGAQLDVPSGAGLEQIVEDTGPKPADEVLTQLLNGSGFDFVIVKSPESPHLPTRIMLLSHSAATSVAAPASSAGATPVANREPQLYGAGFIVDPSEEEKNSTEAALTPEEDAKRKAENERREALGNMQREILRQRQLAQQPDQGAPQISLPANAQ